MMLFHLSKGSKRLLLIMPIVAVAIVLSGVVYFRSVNQSEDPRVLTARTQFGDYDRLMRENRFSEALTVLDTIAQVYRHTPGYALSFELGVVENNRASVYLVQAETERLSQKHPPKALIDGYLDAAQKHSLEAVAIYRAWMATYQSASRKDIAEETRVQFYADRDAFPEGDIDDIIAKRVNDIVAAIEEMPRRQSVTHTNLGVIARYQGLPETAKDHYEAALALWDRNHVARNNLNVLMGRPVKNRSLLETLFPPSRQVP